MKIFSISFFFLTCSLIFFNLGQAQQQQMYFEKHDVISGLPESSVREIIEDQQGYIWMATQNGLVRYDGYRYKVYQLGSEKVNLEPITTVTSLYKDRNNFIWASTVANGLFKYNRNSDTFIQFAYPEKEMAIVYKIFTDDKAGNLWGIAFKDSEKNYLWKLDKNGLEFFGNKFKNTNYIDASRIYSGFVSSSGKVWFGTNNGFYSYEGKNIPLKGYLTQSNSKQFEEVVYLYEPPSEPGIFWMVTFQGKLKNSKIVRFDSKSNTYKEFNPKPEYFSFASAESYGTYDNFKKFFNCIYEDKKKQLWFAGEDGLVKLDRKTEKFNYYNTGYTYQNLFDDRWLFDFKETKEGFFWLSSPGGLVRFDPKTAQFERYLADSERPGSVLVNRDVNSKMFDHTGAFWVGFAWAGANKSNRIKSAFTVYKHNPKQLDSYPKERARFSKGKNGFSWFNDEKVIYKWKEGTNSFVGIYSADPEEPFVSEGCQTKEGNFYITTLKNLVFYNTKTGKKEKYAPEKITPESFLYGPVEDDNGLIWMGTSHDIGICSFNPKTKKIKAYPYREIGEKMTSKNAGALDDGRVLTTYVDRQHNFWVGTNQGSINLYDPVKDCFVSYFNKQNRGMSCITDIYEDTSGRFWVGTYQDGIFEFDRKKGRWIRHLNEATGLLYNGVLGIKEDALGQIWVTTDRGLSRINPKDLTVKNFPLNTILTGYDIRSNTQNLHKLDNGNLMFVLTNGAAVFNPKDLDANPFPPKVLLEEIAVNNPKAKKEEYTTILTYGKKEIQLTYKQNRIRFNYIGLQYDDPATNIYAYKLDGYDNDWVQAGTQRTVTYTNLSPGNYTFHVKAANSDGVWSTENAAINIIISPPWWLTWWAYVLYFIVFVVSIPSYIAYRGRALKRENAILEEKVSHRTNQLTKSIEELKTTQSQLIQSEKMASLGELTAGIAHEIQNPLNFVNNFSEVSMELIDEMQEEMTKGDTTEALTIATDIKQNLEKINYHGKRADGIVKGMLQHSRAGNNVKEPTNINGLADEYLRLAYHGLRAKDKSFNAELITHLDKSLPKVNVIPQDIGRVLLNLFTNAFYATHQKQKILNGAYKPMVNVTTILKENAVEITVKDNGIGISDAIKDKIMQPFFTTKPAGEGTGLGLSLSYDIVVKGHGGTINIESNEKEYTVFTIRLPIE